MSVIQGNVLAGSGGYQITNSVRLRAAASAYFSRAFGTPTTQNTFTFSAWVKRSKLAALQNLFGVSTNTSIGFPAADTLVVTIAGTARITTTGLYRDPSAWCHVQYKQTTGAAELYFNGVSVGTSATVSAVFNTAVAHQIGAANTSNYTDGYLADVYFVDGQALSPSSFGQTDSNGVWAPKAYTGTYGTNGFHLDFKDAALTAGSNVGLGKDVSGNGNYCITNNISVTAGVTYDSMVDTPTNNYATLNPLVPTSITGTNFSYAAACLRSTHTATAAFSAAIGSIVLPTSGKFYCEAIADTTTGSTSVGFGVASEGLALNADLIGLSNAWGLRYDSNRRLCLNGTTTGPIAGTLAAGDKMQIAADIDNGRLWLGVNDAWYDTVSTTAGNPSSNSNPTASLSLAGKVLFFQGYRAMNNDVNFGQRPFAFTPPTNFKALCTANLPAVAIAKPAAHLNAKPRVGTAATYSVTGEAFQPDFVWVKSRGRALDHALYDSVRGVQKRLETNNTDAEVTGDSTGLTAFNSDGYTGGALDQINGTTATNSFVDWLWKAGGAPTTDNVAGAGNTPTASSVKIDGANLGSVLAGTIAATRLSANTTAGFSVVTYTGTGANATIAHGLGVAPKMVITRCRNYGSARNWSVWHSGIANTEFLNLNGTDAKAADATMWNSTSPTTSVFSVGSNANSNLNTYTFVAYCFAEIAGYSKFSSYVGNAAADGPFVHCGFRPRYLMVKRTDVAGAEWDIVDAARSSYNGVALRVYADSSAVEDSTGGSPYVDFTATGFKVRTTNTDWNASTGTYIFAAFAEHPFGGSNVSPSPAR